MSHTAVKTMMRSWKEKGRHRDDITMTSRWHHDDITSRNVEMKPAQCAKTTTSSNTTYFIIEHGSEITLVIETLIYTHATLIFSSMMFPYSNNNTKLHWKKLVDFMRWWLWG